MMPRVALVTGWLFVACLGLIAGARAIGQTAPLSPTYLETGDCEQPCWQGIKPGVNTREQFAQRTRTVGLYAGHATDYGDGIAAMFELSTYGALRLADVLRAFGSPERVGCLGFDHTTMYPGRNLAISARLYFAGGLVEVNAVRPDESLRLTPDMQVRSIRYYAPGEPAYPIGETTGWHGFASSQVYLLCHY